MSADAPGPTRALVVLCTIDTDEAARSLADTLVDRRFAGLRDAIAAEHPYDVPEIVALPIETGLAEYLDWIGASTS